MNSIQLRLQLSLLASVGAIFLLLLWGGGKLARQLGEDFIQSRLEHDAESLVAALDLSDPDAPVLDARLADPVFRRPLSGHYYVVRVGDNELRSPSLWDSDFSIEPIAAGERRRSYREGPSNQQLLLNSSAYEKRGTLVGITVAEDIAPLLDEIALFRKAFALLALALFAVASMLQFTIVRGAFGRLNRVTRDVRRLAEGTLDSLPEHAPGELRPLVAEINRLLALLGQRVERSRRALGDLAHALKGPLNLQMQTLQGGALAGDPDLREHLLEQAERIQTLMNRELRRARLAGTATPGQHFSVERDLPDLLETVKRMHANRELDFESRFDIVAPLSLDREDLLELLGNLLDNAAKWANRRVICRAWSARDSACFSVEDDGPGCPDEALPTLTTRGVRLDERVDGQGLGLSIAGEIAGLYGGALAFDRSAELGGLRVRVSLPGTGGQLPD